jgi:hypothetical protein
MNPKKLIASLLIGAQLVVAAPVYAQDPPPVGTVTLPEAPKPAPGEPDVGAAISPMKKGQVAPFTGILLSPKATATIVAQLNTLQEQIKIEVDHARAEEKAKCDFQVAETRTHLEADKKVLQAQVDSRDKQINILNGVIKQHEENRPNTSLWVGLGTGLGFVVGAGLTVLTVYVVNQAQK